MDTLKNRETIRPSVYLLKAYAFLGILLIISGKMLSAQEKYLHFTEINGLPRNITTCLEQDKYGYLWIGTANGIARYDGKNFHSYPESVTAGIIHMLYDSHNYLWVATDKGLFKYNRVKNVFEIITEGYISKLQEDNGAIYFLMVSAIYKVDNSDIEMVYQGADITDFCFSDEGIWLGSNIYGVKLLSREGGFKNVAKSYLDNKSVSTIIKINGELLAGCYNGQLYSISINGSIRQLEIENQNFFEEIDKVGDEIWLATDGNGIIVLDEDFQFSRRLSRSNSTSESINSNSIYDILPGNNQEVWIASYGAGITCILPDNRLFQNILPEKGNINSLVSNEGVSVLVSDDLMFFGTNYGLSKWDERNGNFKNLTSDKLRKDLNGSKVTALHIDNCNNIWVGTYDGLLGKYTQNYDLVESYHPSSSGSDEMQQIVYLHEIDADNLLILTQFHRRILLKFNIKTKRSDVFELYSKGSNITYCLLNSVRENQQGELLAIISDQGLFHINWEDNVIENRLSALNNRIENNISDFYQDKEGYYWLTSTNGLLRIAEDSQEMKRWTVKDGLPTNTLVRIESNDDRFLWISTIDGICRFDTKTEEVLNFNHRDGLPANEFQERVSAKTNDGRIIFGSYAGFTIIDPLKVNQDSSSIEVIISDITFQNQSIRSADGVQLLKAPLEETTYLQLPYNKNSFSLHFFVKNKSFIQYHSYAYRLLGLEEDWTYLWESNYATYTNLSPGNYTFEIKSAGKTREGKVTQLSIRIQAPWYLSWYAFSVYGILFFTIIYLSFYAYIKRIQLKKEKDMSEFKIQKEHELTENKLEFFTNISHDLKTPLTLIDAPVSDLLRSDNLSPEQINKLTLIQRNSRRLFSLITDLLDFRKLTQKQYILEVKETDIANLIEDICTAFNEECKNKSIRFNRSQDKHLQGYVDSEKIRKIVWNLLSNAFKYTSNKGVISLIARRIVDDGIENLELIIQDNGIGISEDELDNIFKRFFKARNHKQANRQGAGIGLSIVKELVEMHRGTIQVESKLGSGTTFSIHIPIARESYTESEITGNTEPTPHEFEAIHDSIPVVLQETHSLQKQYNLPSILLVEDNSDLRQYLAGHLQNRYKVYQAEDGAKGLELATAYNPDIILTDVEMPNMNGYDFCKEIRRNFDTSHIPIVMLTANDTVEQQIEGISKGADTYLTKPFEIDLLDTIINSLLESRRKLRIKFAGLDSPDKFDALAQKDIEFITGIKEFIEENLTKQDLNVEQLSERFAISLAQLNRKIKALTGLTPNNLIKSFRLRKAYKLIQEEGLRVSEAAYQTGFNDPNYFTTCFKKEFGENPSQVGLKGNESV